MHDFLKDGALTEDGKKVVAYLNEALKSALADKNPSIFNNLSGMVKDYGMNVAIAGFATTEAWLAGHPNSAEAILELALAEEAKQHTATEAAQATEGVSKLTEELAKLQKFVEELDKKHAQEIADLKEAKTPEWVNELLKDKPVEKPTKKKADKTEEEAE